MEKIELRLNDFLYNSGILGFYRILRNVEKEECIEIKGNTLIVEKQAIENFEEDYIKTMIHIYEKQTKWYAITSKKEWILKIDTNNEEEKSKLDNFYKEIKKAMESASYKAGYEIVKEYSSVNPYDMIEQIKNQKESENKKQCIIKIIEHLEENKETYCMKDIIYTKINCFWENVAFLNKMTNKNDIKQEYINYFINPIKEYFDNKKTGELNCIECGNKINKKESFATSWLKDVGVDLNRKKSGFWNFKEDTYICPICNLIYSCIPLGFTMIGSNGIFVNNNESFNSLKSDNSLISVEEIIENRIDKVYQKILKNYIEEIGNEKFHKYEPKNIQVVKRIGNKDNQKYEFNMIAKDKLEILKNTTKYFEKLINTDLYQTVLSNLLQGIKQYKIINQILNETREDKYKYKHKYIETILIIQLNSIGGIELQEKKEMLEDIIREGEKLQIFFYKNSENVNKLESYKYKLQTALNANNVAEFLKIFTMFYGSIGQAMPRCSAMKELIENEELFRLFGYSYIYGLGKMIDKKEEKGGNGNEE